MVLDTLKRDRLVVAAIVLYGLALLLAFALMLYPVSISREFRLGFELVFLGLTVISVRRGLFRLHLQSERYFWNLITLGLCLWGLSWLIREYPDWFRRGWTSQLLLDLCYLSSYLAILFGIESKPHYPEYRLGVYFNHRLQLAGTTVFGLGMMAYFILVPRFFQPVTPNTATPTLVPWLCLDAIILVAFMRLFCGRVRRKWRYLYAIFAVATFFWMINDYLREMVFDKHGNRPGSWFWVVLFSTPFLLVLVAGALKNHRFPLQSNLEAKAEEDESFWVSRLNWVYGYAFLFPAIHLIVSLLGLQDSVSREARQLVVVAVLAALAMLALIHGHFLRRSYRAVWQRKEEMVSLKKARSELENKIERRTFQLSETAFSLQREKAKTQELELVLRQSEKRYRVLVETMTEGMGVIDENEAITYVNQALCRMLKQTSGEMIGQKVQSFFNQENQAVYAHYLEKRERGGEGPFEISWLTRDGHTVPTIMSPRSILDERGRFLGSFSVVTDITELKRAETEMRFLAQNDSLTKLPNRELFRDRLERAILGAKRGKHLVAVLFIDLDRFKRINDSLGHGIGDLLLQGVAERLAGCVRKVDTVSRLGGDEFALVLPGIRRSTDVLAVVEKIQALFAKSFCLDGFEATISLSIGISMYPSDGEQPRVLLRNADAAMYHAKLLGRNNYQFYTRQMNEAALQRLTMENELRLALEHEQFVLHYQPKVCLQARRIVGVEALVRWRHPERGMIGADQFISVAQECGLIGALGEWVMETACSQAKSWQLIGIPPITMAVNLSATQFKTETLPAKVLSVLSKTELAPEHLQLEITESLAMEDAEMSIAVLGYLRALGLHIAIDDFGTGYSSLSYLKRFSIDTLKIDRGFISQLLSDEANAAIVTAIITMAHGLDLTVIAQGVETKAQLKFLVEHGCDQVQGFYIGKAVAPEGIQIMMEKEVE